LHLEGHSQKEQDPDLEPNPLVIGTDPKIGISTKMSRIRNTTKNGLYVLQVSNLIVHILARAYTASNPWLTDCDRRLANSWLLKIFRLHPGKKVEKKFMDFSSY
jgi:hypothetical protein